MTRIPYSTFGVEVPDGILHVGQWGDEGPVVLALHGITANHMGFAALGERLGDHVRLVAPDLRGRGRSRDVGDEFSMAHHADDCVAVLDHLGVDQALVLGHSMGGFITAVLADRHPDRVCRLLLVDGGLPLDLPEEVLELPTDQLIAAVIGPAMARLDMTFASEAAYLDLWRPHPAFQGSDWNDHVERYVTYDLTGEAPELRPSSRKEAVFGDTESQLVRDDVVLALSRLRHPTLLVRAERGITDADPLYAPDHVAAFATDHPVNFRWTTIDDVNHYTIVIGDRGADALTDLIDRELEALG